MNAGAQAAVHAMRGGRLPGRRTGRRRSPPGSPRHLGQTAKRLGRAAAAGELSLCAAIERLVAAAVDPPVSPAERDALLRIALATYVACQRQQPNLTTDSERLTRAAVGPVLCTGRVIRRGVVSASRAAGG